MSCWFRSTGVSPVVLPRLLFRLVHYFIGETPMPLPMRMPREFAYLFHYSIRSDEPAAAMSWYGVISNPSMKLVNDLLRCGCCNFLTALLSI